MAVCSVSLGVCHGAGRRVRHKCLERKDKIRTARTTGISETPIIFIMGWKGDVCSCTFTCDYLKNVRLRSKF